MHSSWMHESCTEHTGEGVNQPAVLLLRMQRKTGSAWQSSPWKYLQWVPKMGLQEIGNTAPSTLSLPMESVALLTPKGCPHVHPALGLPSFP